MPSESDGVTAVADGGCEVEGLLVVVTGADARGKDLIVAAARRRFAKDARFEFPARIATRACDFDDQLVPVPCRVFRSIEGKRGFAISWQRGAQRHGFTDGALLALDAGRIVVVAIPEDAVPAFCRMWQRTVVVRVASHLDGVRHRIPRAGPRATLNPADPVGRIEHSGNVADAVRQLSDILDRLAFEQRARKSARPSFAPERRCPSVGTEGHGLHRWVGNL